MIKHKHNNKQLDKQIIYCKLSVVLRRADQLGRIRLRFRRARVASQSANVFIKNIR